MNLPSLEQISGLRSSVLDVLGSSDRLCAGAVFVDPGTVFQASAATLPRQSVPVAQLLADVFSTSAIVLDPNPLGFVDEFLSLFRRTLQRCHGKAAELSLTCEKMAQHFMLTMPHIVVMMVFILCRMISSGIILFRFRFVNISSTAL